MNNSNQKTIVLATRTGQMGECLGVSKATSDAIDTHISDLLKSKRDCSLIDVFESVRDNFDLNLNEWSAFMFGLGHWSARIDHINI